MTDWSDEETNDPHLRGFEQQDQLEASANVSRLCYTDCNDSCWIYVPNGKRFDADAGAGVRSPARWQAWMYGCRRIGTAGAFNRNRCPWQGACRLGLCREIQALQMAAGTLFQERGT
jgi:hypothetical protein